MQQFVYPAQCAHLGHQVYNTSKGLTLAVSGYHHKLPLLLSKVLERLAHPKMDPARFQIQKDLQLKEYSNFFKSQPYALARYAVSHLLEMSRWHILEYVEVIGTDDCTQEELVALAPRLFKQIHVIQTTAPRTRAPRRPELAPPASVSARVSA